MATPTAPIPEVMPGRFFVLGYDRLLTSYSVVLDDEDKTSFRLGTQIQPIRLLFMRWLNNQRMVDDAIDRAREFLLVQVIPSQNRIRALFDRTIPQVDLFQEQPNAFTSFP